MIEKNLVAVANAYKNLKDTYYAGKSIDAMRRQFLRDIKKQFPECALKYDFICGKDTLNVDGVTKNYLPKEGDTLIIDISVRVEGRWCDVCRTYFFGQPTEEQKQVFNLVARSISVGERVLKKGKSAKTVYKKVDGVYRKKGQTLIHHAGHRIGSRALMQPQFLPENGKRIRLGEYYTIESGLYKDFGLRLENDYLITESGAKNLFIDLMPFDIKEYILK